MSDPSPEPLGAESAAPASDYDTFVDWGKRLEREGPFFRRVFEEAGVRRVLDVGCGSGMHALMWAGWGLDVIGADPDDSMLAQAEANRVASAGKVATAGGRIAFVKTGFGQLASADLGTFDALTCTGNALPHVAGPSGLRDAFDDFASVLRPGGVLVLHLLNHDRLLAQRIRSIPPVVRETAEGTRVFLRVMDYSEGEILFDFVTMRRSRDAWATGAAWEISSRRSAHTALPSPVMLPALEVSGFGDVNRFGDHSGAAFDPTVDESVIVVAVRGPEERGLGITVQT